MIKVINRPLTTVLMDETTFYFTEYTIQTSLEARQANEEIRESLVRYVQSSEPVVVEENESWYFGETDRRGERIIGKFGRSFSDNSTIYNESKGDFEDEAVVNKKAEYCMFVLDLDRSLLIYHSKNRIGHQQFRNYFSEGYERFMEGTATLETELIRNEQDVDRVVEERPVRRAEFRLRSSNPSSDPAWEDIDNEMKVMLARKLNVDVESIENGSLNFDEDLLRDLYEMSKSEYGEYDIYYDENGELTVVSSTSSKPVQKREEKPDSLDDLRSKAAELVEHALFFL